MKVFVAAAAAALFGSGLAQAQATAESGGPGAVGAFSRLDAGGEFELRVVPGMQNSVTYEGDARDFAELEYSWSEGRLRVRQDRGWFGRNEQLDVVVTVTYSALDDIRLGRGVDARIEGLDVDRLDLEINTGAIVEMDGRCERLDLDIHTGGELDAENLICADVNLDSATGAIARVHATRSIDASASTGAEIRVHGNPQQRRSHSRLGGEVRILAGGVADNR